MASLKIAAVSSVNGSWAVLSASVLSWVGFRNKLFRRYKRRRFSVRQMCRNEERTKPELARLVKRSESLRWILKLYGLPVDQSEETNGSTRLYDHIRKAQQLINVPSSALGNSQMRGEILKLPDSLSEVNHYESADTSDNHRSGQKLIKFHILKMDSITMILLPTFVFCISCILWAFQRKISRNSEDPATKTPRVHHQGSKKPRWRSVMGGVDEQDSLQMPDNRANIGDEEAPEDVHGGYSKVEREYQRFLSDCGIAEHGYWRGGSYD